ncbi:MAG: acyltransferase family protein [Pseudomonadota bacterium]
MREPGPLVYRPDIDGLRAVAVTAVVAYHAAPALVPGGFVGVDLFFVISGFLISSIILTERDQGRFSLIGFYARRIRRLFPALIVVLAATATAGWYYLLPHEQAALGRHIAAGALYYINFTLKEESGYFDTAAEEKPLLHLWSLAVEEQFYIVWPILLLVVAGRRRLLMVLALITAVSLVANVITIRRDPAAAFFLPQNRFWELGLGALIAFFNLYAPNEFRQKLLSRAGVLGLGARGLTVVASVLGLALILAATFGLSRDVPYPGAWALIPCLGAALIIAAGPEAPVNRWLLSHSPVVFVGLISYPLYLWHWPLLAFPTIVGAIDEPGVRATAVALAIVLATATYLLLERPLRHARTVTVPATLMAGSIVCLGLGLMTAVGALRPRLDAPEYADISAAAGDWSYPGAMTRVNAPSGIRLYTYGSGTDKVLFFGDSNVEQYWPRVEVLARAAPERQTVIFATIGGCPPIPGVARSDSPRCQGFAQKVAELARDPTIRTVVLSANWRGHFLTGQISIDGGAPAPPPRIGTPEAAQIFGRLRAMVGEMRAAGKEVWIVLQIPLGRAPTGWLERRLDGSTDIIIRDTPRRNADANWLPIRDALVAIANATGAGIIDPMEWLCDETQCRTRTEDGRLVHYDRAHLRAGYVREHARDIDKTMTFGSATSAQR